MVFPLLSDVILYLGLVGLAQSERTVAILPTEATAAQNILLYPPGGPALNAFEGFTDSDGGRHTEQHMNMVVDAADEQGLEPVFPRDSA